MTKSDFAKLVKHLLPTLLPGFAAKGDLCLVSPFRGTVRGFQFESSAFSKTDFHISRFLVPLCVPTKQLHFTFGHRVGRSGRWNSMDPALQTNLSKELRKERSFLLGLDAPMDVANALKLLSRQGNIHSLEALAYTLILAGEAKAGEETLNELLSVADRAIFWQQEIASRASMIRDKLRSQPESAREQLVSWEGETAHALGVMEFLASPMQSKAE